MRFVKIFNDQRGSSLSNKMGQIKARSGAEQCAWGGVNIQTIRSCFVCFSV